MLRCWLGFVDTLCPLILPFLCRQESTYLFYDHPGRARASTRPFWQRTRADLYAFVCVVRASTRVCRLCHHAHGAQTPRQHRCTSWENAKLPERATNARARRIFLTSPLRPVRCCRRLGWATLCRAHGAVSIPNAQFRILRLRLPLPLAPARAAGVATCALPAARSPRPKPLMLGMASDVVGSAGSAPLEMSAATVATFRAIMREELSEFEQSISSRFDASFTRLQDELHRETTARKELEQRVARLEATPQPSTQSEDVDKTVAVIGGFGEKDANQTESFLKEILAETDGLVDVYATSPDPVVAFAQFTTQEKVLKFVRAQKTHVGMRQHKLWAAENKPASERKRGKILSKIKKFTIELDSIEPRNIVVNYRRCKVSVRHGGQLVHAAFVAEDGAVEWAVRNCPVSEQVRDAIMDFAEDLE